MDIGSLFKVLLRRWYLVLPCLLVAGSLTLTLPKSIDPEYEVTGAVILLGPEIRDYVDIESGDTITEPVNPLLNLQGSLGQTADALILALGSQSVRNEFAQMGLESNYQLGATSRSPIMEFLVTSDDSELAFDTMSALMTWVEDDLADRQDPFNVGPTDLISVERLSYNNEPSPGLTSRNRASILLAVSGLLLTVLLVVGVDAALNSMSLGRQRKPSRTSSDGGDGTPLPTENTDVSVAVGEPVDEQPHSISEEEEESEEEAEATPRPPWVPNSPSPTRRRSRKLRSD